MTAKYIFPFHHVFTAQKDALVVDIWIKKQKLLWGRENEEEKWEIMQRNSSWQQQIS